MFLMRKLRELRARSIAYALDNIYTVGCDVSTYQDSPDIAGTIDWTKTKAANKFVIMRSSAGIYTDADFKLNYANAGAVKLVRGMYHYMYWNNIDTQIALFVDLIKKHPTELPPVLDYEERPGAPTDKGAARAILKRFLEQIKIQTGRQPILYTSPAFWYDYGSSDTYWSQYKLWIAHYYVTSPTVPAPWSKWSFWQYTPKGDGKAEGMESYGLDKDYYNGSYAQMMLEFGISVPPPELTYEQKVDRLWNAHPELHT